MQFVGDGVLETKKKKKVKARRSKSTVAFKKRFNKRKRAKEEVMLAVSTLFLIRIILLQE